MIVITVLLLTVLSPAESPLGPSILPRCATQSQKPADKTWCQHWNSFLSLIKIIYC